MIQETSHGNGGVVTRDYDGVRYSLVLETGAKNIRAHGKFVVSREYTIGMIKLTSYFYECMGAYECR